MPSLAVRSTTGAAALLLAATLLSACDAGSADPEAAPGSVGSDGASPSASEDAVQAASIRTNVKRGARDVPVDTLLRVAATHGRLSTVTVTGSGDVGALELSLIHI